MTGSSLLIGLNGAECWAYVLKLEGGFRVRFSIDDWERLRLHPGQRIPIRLPGQRSAALYVAEVREAPPVVWVVMAGRMKALR